MFGGNISLGRIFGIPLTISYSWFIILALVTFLLANRMADRYPFWSSAEQWLIGAVATILFFVSVLIHELSHSVLAMNRGIPVRGITLFIFGGISHIGKEARTPLVEFIIAGVGPFSSFILAAAFYAAYLLFHDVSVSRGRNRHYPRLHQHLPRTLQHAAGFPPGRRTGAPLRHLGCDGRLLARHLHGRPAAVRLSLAL